MSIDYFCRMNWVRNSFSAFVLLVLCLGFRGTKVQASVHAAFYVDSTYGCPPHVVHFYDSSSANVTSWNWDFGDTHTSNNQNTSNGYSTFGYYIVSLVVSDGVSFDTAYKTIHIYEPPHVDFTYSDSFGCAGMPITFYDQTYAGSGILTTVAWIYGDNNTDNLGLHRYSSAGIYTVTLIEKDTNNCQGIMTKPAAITLGAKPLMGFSDAYAPGCVVPRLVTFTNNTANPRAGAPPLTYSWSFGDGTFSGLTSPSHAYGGGVDTVKLIATDDRQCSDSTTRIVTINGVLAKFGLNPPGPCTQQTVAFLDSTAPTPNTWFWDYGDGNGTSTAPNPTHAYSSGSYVITLITTLNGCSDTARLPITVSPPIAPSFNVVGNTSDCKVPFTVSFNNTTTGASTYLWNFGDGNTSNSTASTVTHTYTIPGTFNVSLTAFNVGGCAQTVTHNNVVNIALPHADFVVDKTHGCSPLTVHFTNTSSSIFPINSYSWNFGILPSSTAQNPPNVTYTAPGTYVAYLIVRTANGCVDTSAFDTIQAGSHSVPVFTVNQTSGCHADTFRFTNSSTGAQSYLWEFGDGLSSTVTNPKHVYRDTASNHTVTLISQNNGCVDSLRRPNFIHSNAPLAGFSYTYNCSNITTVPFLDLSVGATSWTWTFGDGSAPYHFNNVTHTFLSGGIHHVTQTVTSSAIGCTDSFSQNVNITGVRAKIWATRRGGCGPLTIFFRDSSQGSTSRIWDFGDGPVDSTHRNTSHTYSNNGVYHVKLIANPNSVCRDSDTITITVTGPVANFGADTTKGCNALTVNFRDSSYSNYGTIVSWSWNFGDGSPIDNSQNPTHTFHGNQNYSVYLTVFDSTGCHTQAAMLQYINMQPPYVRFSCDTNVCVGEPASFHDHTFGAYDSVIWYFGDSDTSHNDNPLHPYRHSGYYSVTLTVFGSNGCDSTYTIPNLIHVTSPKADFSFYTAFNRCPPAVYNFVNLTNRLNLTWQWDFGDSTQSTLTNPTHTYLLPGAYTVRLIAYSSGGCNDTITKHDTVRVYGPIGHFTLTKDTGCVPHPVTISGTGSGGIQTIVCDMNNGNFVNDSLSFTYVYTTPGVYAPYFTLIDSNNCSVNYALDTVHAGVVPFPNLHDTSVCQGNYVKFDLPYGDHFLWTPPTKLTCDTCGTTTSQSRDTIHYHVHISTDLGCVADDSITINVVPLPKINPGSNQTVCQGETVQLSAGNVVKAVWFPSTYLNDSNLVQPTAIVLDSIAYEVTGTNDVGCSITRTVKVFVIHKVHITAMGDTTICLGQTAPLSTNVLLQPKSGLSYSWTPSATLNNANASAPVAQPDSNTKYRVIARGGTCIPDTQYVRVNVSHKPQLTAGDSTHTTAGSPISVHASSLDSVTFRWFADDSFVCPTCDSTQISPRHSQQIIAEAINAYGCVSFDTFYVSVLECSADMVYVPNTFTPNGDDVNDKLFVRTLVLDRLDYFRLFDRWGEQVFYSNDLNTGWDGTFHGLDAPPVVYIYTLRGICTNGIPVEKRGNVTIVR